MRQEIKEFQKKKNKSNQHTTIVMLAMHDIECINSKSGVENKIEAH
jgi:hypothetical protein